ncbi:MAG: hypothetical protein QOE49_4467 [Rhodospirillaceae bacterium]|nr:hypothetical protein [Rhodospirillaceae bacterium]
MIVRRCLRRSIVGALGILAMAACTSMSPEAATSAVPSPSAFLGRLRPADLGREFEAAQLVTVSRDTKSFVVDVRLSVRADRLMLVAQDMLGQRLLTVMWTDTGIVEERSPNLPAAVSPVGLLADLVAICGPEDAVRRALEQSGARLIVQDGQRIIVSGGEETMRATLGWQSGARWTGRMSYRNVRAGYSVEVQSVEQS